MGTAAKERPRGPRGAQEPGTREGAVRRSTGSPEAPAAERRSSQQLLPPDTLKACGPEPPAAPPRGATSGGDTREASWATAQVHRLLGRTLLRWQGGRRRGQAASTGPEASAGPWAVGQGARGARWARCGRGVRETGEHGPHREHREHGAHGEHGPHGAHGKHEEHRPHGAWGAWGAWGARGAQGAGPPVWGSLGTGLTPAWLVAPSPARRGLPAATQGASCSQLCLHRGPVACAPGPAPDTHSGLQCSRGGDPGRGSRGLLGGPRTLGLCAPASPPSRAAPLRVSSSRLSWASGLGLHASVWLRTCTCCTPAGRPWPCPPPARMTGALKEEDLSTHPGLEWRREGG